jgi:hypothetical protein
MIEDVNRLNEEQENNLWKEAIFVFDTSALLNLYEYSDSTISDIFTTTFKDLEGRIWIPFNVSLEYTGSRHRPIDKLKKEYVDLENNFKNIENNLEQIKNKTKSKEKHPFFEDINLEDFVESFRKLKSKSEAEIKSQNEILLKKLENDVILNFINSNFSIGYKYSYSEISNIVAEGEFRFRNSIPPGYKDESSKQGFQKYADLIIWKQIIDYSKKFDKSIVFVMDDLKEDWWILDKRRKPLSPRAELLEELNSASKRRFWMYQTTEFIKKSKTIIKSKIQTKSIEDILAVSEKHFISSKIYLGVELSANKQQEEPWRIKRLENVIMFYSKTISEINISELYDHKGTLTVYWFKEPTKIEKNTIKLAWENELEYNLEHVILK